MFRNYHGTTADQVWLQIAADFKKADRVATDSRAGRVFDLGNVCLSIGDPRQRWITSREPAMNPAFALAEVIWIANGRNDAKFLNYFNRQLPRFAGDHVEYPGAYGFRLRKNLGLDQLERAYLALSSSATSRQVVLQIWDSRFDLPLEDGSPATTDVPCNVVSLLKVRREQLVWTQVLRSNDFYLGLPHNIVQFTSLQEIMAGWLGIECGSFNLVTDSLHLYERDVCHLKASANCTDVENTDAFTANKSDAESHFRTLAQCVDSIADSATSTNAIFQMAHESRLTNGFRNMLCVLAAEGLRRRKDMQLAGEVMRMCTNAAYSHMWSRWISRTEVASVA